MGIVKMFLKAFACLGSGFLFAFFAVIFGLDGNLLVAAIFGFFAFFGFGGFVIYFFELCSVETEGYCEWFP